jgi:hypothetical protein
MHLGFLIWHRKARPLAGIRLNGGEWYPGGGAKQDDVTGWGINAGMLARVCVCQKSARVGYPPLKTRACLHA